MPQGAYPVTATTAATADSFPLGGFLRTGLFRSVLTTLTATIWWSSDGKNFFPLVHMEALEVKAEDTSRENNNKIVTDRVWLYVSAGTATTYWLGTVY